LPPVDLGPVPLVVDLAPLSLAEGAALRPVVGGKATGLVGLTSAGVSTVDAPVAITIKPYIEHLTTTGLATTLPQLLQDRSFAGDVVVRRIVLEGDGAVSPAVAASFRESRPPGTLLRDVVDAGGVKGIIRDTPIAAATLTAIVEHLELRFGRYADSQGLRFRSSSTIEDAEGFNGAGLYESHTGFLRPPRARDDDVATALRKTWASYWGIEAFEERRLARADHLSGAMAVVVHANFPDAREVDNGVALFTILPPRSQTSRSPGGFVLEVNQQLGSHSVTNPPPGSPHLPEIDRVVVDVVDGVEQPPRIERVRASTLVLPGDVVLSDATLLRMFADARAVTTAWLAGENAGLLQTRQKTTLTLDLETRTVSAGWPALRSGVVLPSRLVWKQARPLEPATIVPDDIKTLPIPGDILARARAVTRSRCEADDVVVSAVRVTTDEGMSPDLGFALAPFVSFVVVDATADLPALGLIAGDRKSALHTAFSAVVSTTSTFDVTIADERRARLGLDRVIIDTGSVTVMAGGSITRAAECDDIRLYASPAAFLDGLLAAR
jgi:hypothetical protein